MATLAFMALGAVATTIAARRAYTYWSFSTPEPIRRQPIRRAEKKKSTPVTLLDELNRFDRSSLRKTSPRVPQKNTDPTVAGLLARIRVAVAPDADESHDWDE